MSEKPSTDIASAFGGTIFMAIELSGAIDQSIALAVGIGWGALALGALAGAALGDAMCHGCLLLGPAV